MTSQTNKANEAAQAKRPPANHTDDPYLSKSTEGYRDAMVKQLQQPQIYEALQKLMGTDTNSAEKKSASDVEAHTLYWKSPAICYNKNRDGMSPSGKAQGFGPCIRGFESLHPNHFLW